MKRREFIKVVSMSATVGNLAASLGRKASAAPAPSSRTVRVRASDATSWDYGATNTSSIDFVNEPRVRQMVDRAVQELAGTATAADGWNALFPYTAGEKVAIKGNFSQFDRYSYGRYVGGGASGQIYPTPQVIRAIVDGLADYVGVPLPQIYIFELAYELPAPAVIGRAINYVTRGATGTLGGADLGAPVSFRTAKDTEICAPLVLTQAAHLIDLMGMRTGGIGGIPTDCFKNHYGTVRHDDPSNTPAFHLHDYHRNNIIDIRRNTHVKDKTRLIICDLLYAATDRYLPPQPWDSFPTGPATNSILVSRDPVAITSVQVDYLNRERALRGQGIAGHDYLHDAADTFGLGVHEHGVFGTDFSYTQIDYRVIDLDGVAARGDIDRKIKELKAGQATDAEVKELIRKYREGS